MKRSLFIIMIITAIIYSGTALTSCKKKGDTIGSVTVLDTAGLPLPGANVTLWQDTAHNPVTGSQGSIRVSKDTDGSGKAQFTFPNEAFLNIWAIKDLDTAFGFIRLEQNKTIEQTVHF